MDWDRFVEGLPSLVPSHYCLQCRGCCVFTRQVDLWRPRVFPEERTAIQRAAEAEGLRGLEEDGSISRVPVSPLNKARACVFLRASDHHCRIYPKRPWECRLYPFLVSRTSSAIRVFRHLSCPFVQEQQGSEEAARAVENLRRYLTASPQREWLYQHREILADYSAVREECEHVFDI